MSSDDPAQTQRSYGCTFGCGNPYDFILINVTDGSTEFVCTPCFIRLASDMVAAITSPDNPKVAAALATVGIGATEQPPGPSGKPRGHNAPATNDDPDLFDAFDGVTTYEELPDEFK